MTTRDITGSGFSEVPVAPRQEAPVPRDHNQPPELLVGEPLIQRLMLSHKDQIDRAKQLLASEARAPKNESGNIVCEDETWEVKFTDLIRQIQDCHKKLEGARVAEKAVYDAPADTVHQTFRGWMDKLVSPSTKKGGSPGLKERIEAAVTAFKVRRLNEQRKKDEEAAKLAREAEALRLQQAAAAQEEADRLAAEAARKRNPEIKAAAEAAALEAQRLADDEAARLAEASDDRAKSEEVAAAPAADLTRARGNYGVGSLQEFVDFRDLDGQTLHEGLSAVIAAAKNADTDALACARAMSILWGFIKQDALESAIRDYLKVHGNAMKVSLRKNPKDQPLRGVTFFLNHKTNTR